MRTDRAAHVRKCDYEPERDGQAERDEDLGVGVRIPRVDVDHERRERERRRCQHPSADVDLPSVSEVRGEERQHEQAEVPREPARFFVREIGSEARDLDRDSGGGGKGEGLDPAARRALRLVTRQNELFPQSAAVLACELAGQGVEVAHPLHGDQEGLVFGEPGRAQLGDLVAKMILQLVDVMAVDRRGACHKRPPLCDL